MTLFELIDARLHEMILELADDIASDKLGLNLTEDEAAGVPFALFNAEQVMRSALEHFVTHGETC